MLHSLILHRVALAEESHCLHLASIPRPVQERRRCFDNVSRLPCEELIWSLTLPTYLTYGVDDVYIYEGLPGDNLGPYSGPWIFVYAWQWLADIKPMTAVTEVLIPQVMLIHFTPGENISKLVLYNRGVDQHQTPFPTNSLVFIMDSIPLNLLPNIKWNGLPSRSSIINVCSGPLNNSFCQVEFVMMPYSIRQTQLVCLL